MGTALTRVCSGISSWQLSSVAVSWNGVLLVCGCSCVVFHESCLNLTQQHEIGTAGAQATSNTAPKSCCPSETAPKFKILADRDKMNTGGLCERGREVIFLPGVSGRGTLVLWRSCFICLLACLHREEDTLNGSRGAHTALAPSLPSGEGLGWSFVHPTIFSVVQGCSSLSIFLRWYLQEA